MDQIRFVKRLLCKVQHLDTQTGLLCIPILPFTTIEALSSTNNLSQDEICKKNLCVQDNINIWKYLSKSVFCLSLYYSRQKVVSWFSSHNSTPVKLHDTFSAKNKTDHHISFHLFFFVSAIKVIRSHFLHKF